jgi:hypothetical protein
MTVITIRSKQSSRPATKTANPLKESDVFLHIKVRGYEDQPLFIEPADYHYFEFLLQHNLTDRIEEFEKHGGLYPDFRRDIELLCFSLLQNRLYLLLHQKSTFRAKEFLHTLLTRYARYYRLKYERIGPVFDPSQRVAPIRSQRDFDFVSRSIHLSPARWEHYRYSSLHYYLDENSPPWLKVDELLSAFTSPLAYLAFLKNYEHYQENLKHAEVD